MQHGSMVPIELFLSCDQRFYGSLVPIRELERLKFEGQIPIQDSKDLACCRFGD